VFWGSRLSLLLKTLSCNKYYILWHWLLCIHFLYGICGNFILGHTYYEHSFSLKSRCDISHLSYCIGQCGLSLLSQEEERPLGLAIHFGVDRQGPWWTCFHGELRLYWCELIWCQSDHGDLAYSCGGVDMLGSDGTDSNTQVPIVELTWAPWVMPCFVRP
jgi:hypothetical protein